MGSLSNLTHLVIWQPFEHLTFKQTILWTILIQTYYVYNKVMYKHFNPDRKSTSTAISKQNGCCLTISNWNEIYVYEPICL